MLMAKKISLNFLDGRDTILLNNNVNGKIKTTNIKNIYNEVS